MTKRVIAFGTFDHYHPGHQSFLNQAKKLGDYLLVVVARDTNVTKIKGKLPQNNEKKRALTVRKQNIASKVRLGSKTNNYFRTLRHYKIDLIVLGYDQKPSITDLKKDLRRHRLGNLLVKRLAPYNPLRYKSSLLNHA